VSSGAKVYFSEYRDWPPHHKEAMKHVKGRVLDIGCGAGRHALYLQKKGFNVLGIDNSPLAIKVCKLRGLRRAKVMPITQVNFRPGSFDTVLMLGGNFGLFGSFKRARRLLKKFYRITSDDALIIAESNDPYKTDNPAHLEYQKINRRRGRMSGQLRIRIRFKKYIGDWFDYLIVSKEEMKKIIEGTGWKIKRVIDSMKGPYIAIIEKA
jgi:SAM-dependent methyltransferase